MDERGPFYIKLYVHAIRDENGGGGQSETLIREAIEIMREPFALHNIFFYWDCEIHDFENNSLFNAQTSGGIMVSSEIISNPDAQYHVDALDLYLLPATPTSIIGWSPIGEGLAILGGTNQYVPNINCLETQLLAHEVGHALGLLHTHEPFTQNGDVPDNYPFCHQNLDCVCDTPIDDLTNIGLAGLVNENCELDPIYTTDASLTNLMSYTNVNCYGEFTIGQGERLRNLCIFSNEDNPVVNQPYQITFLERENITTNTTWTTDKDVYGSVEIQPGTTLTIGANATIRFAKNSKLIVHENAKLDLRGTLTSLDCGNCNCDNTWGGVEVHGQTYLPQYYQYQGRLIGRPGSIIENADIGIYVASFEPPNLGAISYSGGIVNCAETTFINNRIGVFFPPYQTARDNKSSFTRCDFITNNNYLQEQKFDSFAKLISVNGIEFNGCSFRNEQTDYVENSLADYGYGIQSFFSGFSVNQSCTSNTAPCSSYKRSEFNGLGYGIYNATAFTKSNSYQIKSADFKDNYFGIYVNSVDNGTILHNDFFLGNVPNTSVFSGNVEQVGIMLENDMGGFTLEENDFKNDGGNVDITVGSICKNLGRFNNEVRRNTYEGVDIGNLALGENSNLSAQAPRGLNYLCNDNSLISSFDIHASNAQSDVVIRGIQGEFDVDLQEYKATGNSFSFPDMSGVDLRNDGPSINYHYFNAGTQKPNVIEGDIEEILSNENLCPEDYCEPPCKTDSQLQAGKQKYYTEKNERESAKVEYEQAVSTGDDAAAEMKKQKMAYHRRAMDKEAFMTVLHLVNDSISIDEDSLILWVENLYLFSIDMFLSIQQQSEGNTVAAQRTLTTAGKRENLTPRERTALKEVPSLLQIIKGKKPFELNSHALKELEELARDDYGMVGNISRNILTLHGYHFPPIYSLPITKEEVARKRSSDSQENMEDKGRLFPNPAKDKVTVQFPMQIEKQISFTCKLFDVSGTLVKTLSGASGESQLFDIQSLTSGLYYYHFSGTNGTIQSGKLIIQ